MKGDFWAFPKGIEEKIKKEIDKSSQHPIVQEQLLKDWQHLAMCAIWGI